MSTSTTEPLGPTARDVQHPLPRPHTGEPDGETSPQPVDAKGHDIIDQVVPGGHGVEHRRHHGCLFFNRHLPEAEVGGAGLRVVFRVLDRVETVHENPFPLSGRERRRAVMQDQRGDEAQASCGPRLLPDCRYSSICSMIPAASRTKLRQRVPRRFSCLARSNPSGVPMSKPSIFLQMTDPLRDSNSSTNSLTSP